MKTKKPELVGRALVVGAGVNRPPKPPNSPPGATVVAGTAVLEAPASGTQLGFDALKQNKCHETVPTTLSQRCQ